MPELYEDEVIARFASAIGGTGLTCLLPDGVDRRDGQIRSIQLNIVSTVPSNALLTFGRKRGHIFSIATQEKTFRAENGTIALQSGERFESMALMGGWSEPSKRHDSSLRPTKALSWTTVSHGLRNEITDIRN